MASRNRKKKPKNGTNVPELSKGESLLDNMDLSSPAKTSCGGLFSKTDENKGFTITEPDIGNTEHLFDQNDSIPPVDNLLSSSCGGLISENDENDDSATVTPVLDNPEIVKMIKELQRQVNNMQNDIEAVKTENARLKEINAILRTQDNLDQEDENGETMSMMKKVQWEVEKHMGEIEIKLKEDVKNELDSFKEQLLQDMDEEGDQATVSLKRTWDEHDIQYLNKVDEAIHKKTKELQKSIDDLKQSKGFLTQETTTIKERIDRTVKYALKLNESIEKVNIRVDDQEDRSRRQNLIFFNLPEESGFENALQCEQRVQGVLQKIVKKTLGGRVIPLDRVHRIGTKDPQNKKIRPMIARFTFYKDKDIVLRESRTADQQTFNGKTLIVSEDYGKTTLNIRRDLVNHMKAAKLKNKNIEGGHVNYRTLTLIHKGNARPIYRRVTLKDIEEKPNTWYML